MSQRALTEALKFLNLSDVYLFAVLVDSRWNAVCLTDEVVLHFLQPALYDLDRTKPLREQLKQQWIRLHPRYLLHMSGGSLDVWRPGYTGTQPNAVKSDLFSNSARYVLDSAESALVTGGKCSPNSCIRIDFLSGTVTPFPNTLDARVWHSAALLQGAVYLSGGSHYGKYYRSVERLKDGQWTRVADMTTDRYNHTLCVYVKRIYAFGGCRRRTYLSSVECFDGVQWTPSALTLPTARNYCSLLQLDSRLLLVSGFQSDRRDRYVHVWTGSAWQLLAPTSIDYSLSNAISLKGGRVYVYEHSGLRKNVSL